MKTYAYAVDLGATNVRVALVLKEGKIINKIQKETPRSGANNRVVVNQIIAMLDVLQTAHPHASPAGIGISSLGPLDYARGGPMNPPNMPFSFIPLTKPLQKKFSIPVFLYNDCNAAVLGEQHFGAGKKKKNIVYITISTGIGAGAIVNDLLLLGKSGNAGEIGHMIVDTTYHLPCTCGKGIGHWEGYASGRNMPRFFKAWCAQEGVTFSETLDTAKDIFDRARKKDPTVLRFLAVLGKINARAVSDVIVAYDPDVIAIGGSVMLHNSDLLLPALKKNVDQYLQKPKITMTPLWHDAGLLGAASAVFR